MERHHKAAVTIAACTALALTGCGAGDQRPSDLEDCEFEPATCNSGERADGGEITWALDGSWTGWNPTMASDNNAYLSSALTGMWPATGQFDPEGEYVLNEGLFASEPRLTSESPMTVEYTLKDGANWGDGHEVGVDDFIYHWYSISADDDRCAGCTPASADRGSAVESITGSGRTVTVTYDDTYSSAEWQYAEVLSFPAHIAEDQGFDWKNDPRDMADSQTWFSENAPIGWSAGPYTVTDAEAGQYVVYEPNPDWAGETEVTLDKLIFQVMEGLDAIVTEMRQGTIDGASPVSVDVDTITRLEDTDDVDYRVAAGPSWEHIDLNTRGDLLSDPVLRSAVLIAIDVEDIISRTASLVQFDAERRLNHLFRNDSPNFTDHLSATGQGSGDIELAAGILEDAGYTWDDGGRLLTPDGEEVALDYRYTESKSIRKTTAQLAQANLTDLGIDVTLDPIADADLGSVLFGGEFDIVNFGWSTDPTFVDGASQYWDSESSSNFGGLDDPELDAVLDELGDTLDRARAAELANQAVEMAVDDAYVLPIVDSPVAIMVSDRLVNVRDNWASQQRAMYNVAEWGVSES
ncbi:ABC transporter family substrate-binding protein [Glycomyces arizonensis]|uniref:ABC transporter family substrate-binding protein n=1 Tax=Glycomyces arizonensis TaxID=256035 RepID=UPI0004056105|nr:ABC transporter family substrate-binding protein [Glycomyces arizonensis]